MNDIESRAREMYDKSFTTTGRTASDPQAVSLMVKFAEQEVRAFIEKLKEREFWDSPQATVEAAFRETFGSDL